MSDAASHETVHIERDSDGQFRWTVKDDNGQVVGGSEEGYAHHDHAVQMAKELFPEHDLVDDTAPSA